MVDIQSAMAEIRRGKKEERKKKPQGKNIMSASATQGGHKNTWQQNIFNRFILASNAKPTYCTTTHTTLSLDLDISHVRHRLATISPFLNSMDLAFQNRIRYTDERSRRKVLVALCQSR